MLSCVYLSDLSSKLNPMSFKFVDLFAGIGGFHAALGALGGECVYASEWDKDAARIYERNWNLKPDGDITLAANDEVRAANGPLTVNSPVDAEHVPELMLIVCVPALNPLTVNGLLLYATAAPPSNE